MNQGEKSLRDLHEFFTADMWYAKDAEWKTEADMIKYLNAHFKIALDEIQENEIYETEQRIKKINKRAQKNLKEMEVSSKKMDEKFKEIMRYL